MRREFLRGSDEQGESGFALIHIDEVCVHGLLGIHRFVRLRDGFVEKCFRMWPEGLCYEENLWAPSFARLRLS